MKSKVFSRAAGFKIVTRFKWEYRGSCIHQKRKCFCQLVSMSNLTTSLGQKIMSPNTPHFQDFFSHFCQLFFFSVPCHLTVSSLHHYVFSPLSLHKYQIKSIMGYTSIITRPSERAATGVSIYAPWWPTLVPCIYLDHVQKSLNIFFMHGLLQFSWLMQWRSTLSAPSLTAYMCTLEQD